MLYMYEFEKIWLTLCVCFIITISLKLKICHLEPIKRATFDLCSKKKKKKKTFDFPHIQPSHNDCNRSTIKTATGVQ